MVVSSAYFQGAFRVFSGYFREFSGYFQGVFREFSGCFQGVFQGVFPYALSGYAPWTLPSCNLNLRLRWAKTRVLQTDTRSVETRVLETLACRKNVGGFFKHW